MGNFCYCGAVYGATVGSRSQSWTLMQAIAHSMLEQSLQKSTKVATNATKTQKGSDSNASACNN